MSSSLCNHHNFPRYIVAMHQQLAKSHEITKSWPHLAKDEIPSRAFGIPHVCQPRFIARPLSRPDIKIWAPFET